MQARSYPFYARFFFLAVLLLGFNAAHAKEKEISFADFEILNGKGTSFWTHLSKDDLKDLRFYKALYLKNFPLSQRHNEAQTKIPKILHYIWLGPKEFPADSIAYVLSWQKLHPDWIIKFWTDKAERPLPCNGLEKHLISELSFVSLGSFLDKTENYGEKSDLLRYEILFQEGGVYIDHDIECFHSLDAFASSYDFFTGLEPPHTNPGIESRVFPCNAIIGARPKHPILASTLQLVKERWAPVEKEFPGDDPRSRLVRVMHRTFHSFALATHKKVGQEGNIDIVLPATFFYPDRIVAPEKISSLKSKGLIWTSHKCIGTWKEPFSDSGLLDVKLRLKKNQQKLTKKLKKTQNLLYVNSVLSFSLIAFYVIQRRRKLKSHEAKNHK